MKKYGLHVLTMAIVLCLVSGLVFAQEAPLPPPAAATFDYNRDRLQYEGQAVTPEPTAAPALPQAMESALVPCADSATGPCDLIATKPEDIVGVWKQYLGGPRFNAPNGMAYIRFNVDGTYVIADSVENTAQPYDSYPSGTYQFDDAQLIVDPVVGSPCAGPGIFQLRVLKYGADPVALRYVTISDPCTGRAQDLSQALVWVSGE
jgi:hypothetical protein